jgi:hypothetical protein
MSLDKKIERVVNENPHFVKRLDDYALGEKKYESYLKLEISSFGKIYGCEVENKLNHIYNAIKYKDGKFGKNAR